MLWKRGQEPRLGCKLVSFGSHVHLRSYELKMSRDLRGLRQGALRAGYAVVRLGKALLIAMARVGLLRGRRRDVAPGLGLTITAPLRVLGRSRRIADFADDLPEPHGGI